MNSTTATTLRDEILDLTNSIGDIVGRMNERVKPSIEALNEEQKSHISAAQATEPSLFNMIVVRLIEYVITYPRDQLGCN